MLRPAACAAAHALALGAGAWLLADVRQPGSGGRPPELPNPTVSVIVPARNEEPSLPRLLRSLAAQTRAPDELVVVDDHSEDATTGVAAAGGARVVAAPPLPGGWLGKPWACHQGARRSQGDLLVFLDADVELAPAALEAVVDEWRRGGGLVSVQPHHRPLRPYEQLSATCNLVAMMGTGAFSGPPRARLAMAFGPCLAIGRDLYLRVGGHAHPEVRRKVAEDAALARRVRRAGGPVRAFAGGELVAFRMYPGGVRQLAEGWSKMLAGGAAAAPALPAAATAVWVTGALRSAASGASALAGRHRTPLRRAGDAAVYVVWAAATARLLRRAGCWAPWTAAAFPVPLASFVALSARSAALALTGRPATWRGRPVATG